MNKDIINRLEQIEMKLDAVIAALHEYDDDQLEWPEPNDALKEAAFQYNELEANKRMDVIGQNGNEGIHYVTNEEADENAKSNNNPAKRVGENNVGRNKSKKRKSAIEEHIKYPPHKH